MRSEGALTPREREVLDLIGEGQMSKQIADQLHVSVYTINNHRKHICKKLGLHSTAQLVVAAVRQRTGAQS
jgi:DNA-binding CsgD family transcriptional regulator